MNSYIVSFGTLVFLLIASASANAQWLCREAASTRSGKTITSCGVGKSKNLEVARIKSRESAIEEFKSVCQLSSDCLNFDYSVVPKRTDCEFKSGDYICYRALEFEIGEFKRKSISLNIDDLEKELKSKDQEIQEIQIRIDKINQLKRSQKETEQKKADLADLEAKLNQKEAEALKLQDLNSKETIESGGYRYLHQTYKNSLKVSFYYWDSMLTDQSQKDIMWIVAYEKRPYRWLGLQLYGGFGSGHLDNQKNTDKDVPTMGASNSTQVYNGSLSYIDIGGAALMYSGWRGTYLKVDTGYLRGNKGSYLVSYNGAGVGSPVKNVDTFSKSYFGLTLGFDTRDDQKGWGAFFEFGARKVNDQDNLGFIGGIGFNYGY